jgi:hypothetical protein
LIQARLAYLKFATTNFNTVVVDASMTMSDVKQKALSEIHKKHERAKLRDDT